MAKNGSDFTSGVGGFLGFGLGLGSSFFSSFFGLGFSFFSIFGGFFSEPPANQLTNQSIDLPIN